MKPDKSILDPSFSYTNAVRTDIAKTFERIRMEQVKQIALHVVADTGSKTHLSIFNARRGK